ncbi:MAG: FTR1 family protein [Chloroflexi bacterium SZAS-1]|nr:FTR1 family protein [Chloroflexi bacterium SZAS-1]
MRQALFFCTCLLALAFTAVPAFAATPPLPEQVRNLAQHAQEGIAAADANKPELVRAEYEELHAIWGGFEDQVRAADPQGYLDLEAALDQIKGTVAAQPLDLAAVKVAYAQFNNAANQVADRLGSTPTAPATGLGAQVRNLTYHANEGIAAADANRPELARAEYEELHAIWGGFEDQVRAADPPGYLDLEAALDQIKDTVAAQPLDLAAVKVAYTQFNNAANQVADRLGATPAAAPSAALIDATDVTPTTLLDTLGEVEGALARGDTTAARTQLTSFIRAWPAVEDAIATRSDTDYKAIEASLGQASAALRAEPADTAAATAALGTLRSTLTPYTTSSSYTAIDAGLIILREGLEALLVVVALLAFLRKSGNSHKRGWIWAGAGMGVLASIGAALLLQAIFNQISAGRSRELLEGITGLVAAALLFYVSYWLHSKARLHSWQKYISQQTTQALARGSMIGLALLAFLAVFREGAETAVFYLGMAPSISMRDLLIGIGSGSAILVVLAVLMLVAGVKIPLRPFFRVAGLLVYYLGFKFVGTGLHALQVADALPTSPIGSGAPNPVLEFFGIYLTWQTLLPQLALLVAAVVVYLYLRAQDQRARTLGTAAAT